MENGEIITQPLVLALTAIASFGTGILLALAAGGGIVQPAMWRNPIYRRYLKTAAAILIVAIALGCLPMFAPPAAANADQSALARFGSYWGGIIGFLGLIGTVLFTQAKAEAEAADQQTKMARLAFEGINDGLLKLVKQAFNVQREHLEALTDAARHIDALKKEMNNQTVTATPEERWKWKKAYAERNHAWNNVNQLYEMFTAIQGSLLSHIEHDQKHVIAYFLIILSRIHTLQMNLSENSFIEAFETRTRQYHWLAVAIQEALAAHRDNIHFITVRFAATKNLPEALLPDELQARIEAAYNSAPPPNLSTEANYTIRPSA